MSNLVCDRCAREALHDSRVGEPRLINYKVDCLEAVQGSTGQPNTLGHVQGCGFRVVVRSQAP